MMFGLIRLGIYRHFECRLILLCFGRVSRWLTGRTGWSLIMVLKRSLMIILSKLLSFVVLYSNFLGLMVRNDFLNLNIMLLFLIYLFMSNRSILFVMTFCFSLFLMVLFCLVKMGDNRFGLFFQTLLLLYRQRLFFFDTLNKMVKMFGCSLLMSNRGDILMRSLLILELLLSLCHCFDLSFNDALEQGLGQSFQRTSYVPLHFDNFRRFVMYWQQWHQVMLN